MTKELLWEVSKGNDPKGLEGERSLGGHSLACHMVHLAAIRKIIGLHVSDMYRIWTPASCPNFFIFSCRHVSMLRTHIIHAEEEEEKEEKQRHIVTT